jgi:hypothetical protein
MLASELAFCAGLLGEAVDHGEAQARAGSQRLGREKRIECARRHLRGHPRSRVGHADLHVLPGHHVALPCLPLVKPGVLGLDHQLTAVRHRVTGVYAKIEDRIVQLAGIAEGGPQAAREHR